MPNNAVIEKWVEALESGQYQQTKSYLARPAMTGNDIGYCCLGVLCDLAVKHGVIAEPEMVGEDDQKLLKFDGDTRDLPQSVSEWAGLEDIDVNLDVPAYLAEEEAEGLSEETAIALNDSYGFSFRKIAACIRETYGVGR